MEMRTVMACRRHRHVQKHALLSSLMQVTITRFKGWVAAVKPDFFPDIFLVDLLTPKHGNSRHVIDASTGTGNLFGASAAECMSTMDMGRAREENRRDETRREENIREERKSEETKSRCAKR